MRKLVVYGFTVLSLAFFAGCCPRTSALIEMRTVVDEHFETPEVEEREREKADNNLQRVMSFFESRDSRSAPWRAEAMQTMFEVNRWLGGPTEQSSHHAQVRQLLENEYDSPSFKADDDEDYDQARDKLRAWSIYLLGKMPDEDIDAFLVSELRKDAPVGETQWRISAAIFDALVGRMDRIKLNRSHRNHLLVTSDTFTSQLPSSSVSKERNEQIEMFVSYFRTKLKDYRSVVDLVTARDDQSVSNEYMLSFLEWNYQMFSLEKHLTENNQELYQRNLANLLSLAWHNDERIRVRTRIILTEFDPLSLFNRLVSVLEGDDYRTNEDHELVANLIPVCNSEGADNGYDQRKEKAVGLLFSHFREIATDSREVIYARLLEHEPNMLAAHLIGINSKVMNENENRVLQQIRYLGHLRENEELNDETKKQLASAIAAFMARSERKVRRQVIAQIMDDTPLILATYMVPNLKSLADETIMEARYLLNAYLDCLRKIESEEEELRFAPEQLDRFDRHPYDYLVYAIARPEMDMKATVTEFLDSRDPDRLIGLLAKHVDNTREDRKDVRLEEYVLIGDVAIDVSERLGESAINTVAQTITTGLNSDNEEQVLMCCRYLLELGVDVPDDIRKELPDSALKLLELAEQANNEKGATELLDDDK